jgi:hypothetical protein
MAAAAAPAIKERLEISMFPLLKVKHLIISNESSTAIPGTEVGVLPIDGRIKAKGGTADFFRSLTPHFCFNGISALRQQLPVSKDSKNPPGKDRFLSLRPADREELLLP